jgi:hypothetical protein
MMSRDRIVTTDMKVVAMAVPEARRMAVVMKVIMEAQAAAGGARVMRKTGRTTVIPVMGAATGVVVATARAIMARVDTAATMIVITVPEATAITVADTGTVAVEAMVRALLTVKDRHVITEACASIHREVMEAPAGVLALEEAACMEEVMAAANETMAPAAMVVRNTVEPAVIIAVTATV